MPVSSVQYGQYPWGYVNGLGIVYDSTTLVQVQAGDILDSTGVYQITLPALATVNGAAAGLNGLDTGSLAASTVYGIYVIGDPVTQQATGCMLSANLTTPLMPFGYSAYALVGYITTDSSVHFLKGYWSAGNSSERVFMFDTPQGTAVTAGAATTFTAVSLETIVPMATRQRKVRINTSYTPSAPSHILSLQPQSGTGTPCLITGQVTNIIVTSTSYLFATVNSTHLQINYSVTSGDAVAINVQGYDFGV